MKSRIAYFGKRSCFKNLKKPIIHAVVEDICVDHGHILENLIYVIVGDEALLNINIQHLNHDFYTDIITFDLSDIPKTIDGEIYISIERVIENTPADSSMESEFLRVLFHGVLHLCGLEDKTNVEKNFMRKKEQLYITLYHQLEATS